MLPLIYLCGVLFLLYGMCIFLIILIKNCSLTEARVLLASFFKENSYSLSNDFNYIQGGASKVAIDTASSLNNNGIDVILFSSTKKEMDYKFRENKLNQKECLTDGIKGAIRGINNRKVKKNISYKNQI